MPLSVVFFLSTPERIPEGNLGRQAQAWFLRTVSEHISPELARRLHQEDDLRAYTVSDLFERSWHAHSLSAEAPHSRCALRFTFLDEALAETMQAFLEKSPPRQVEIWWLKLRVEGFTWHNREHPWAGSDSYANLAGPADAAATSGALLHFASPTSFHSEGVDLPLPLPGMVFRSVWRKWNAFSGLPILDDWLGVADRGLQIARIEDLNTWRWKFAEGGRGAVTGFVGNVRFGLVEESCARLGIDPRDAREVLQTLARFAFYSGIGRKTSWGLGQVRPVSADMDLATQERGKNHAAD